MIKPVMKKASMMVAAGILGFMLTACQSAGSVATQAVGSAEGSAEQLQGSTGMTAENTEAAVTQGTEIKGQEAQETDSRETTDTVSGSSLVVYFSWSGNTRNVAEEIGRQTGADLFELVPATPYSEDYDTVLEEAQDEQSRKARSEISDTIEGFENYDVIYLGYPIWYGDAPMVIYTFLESYDLSGKTIVPFCTSGSSGIETSVSSIRSACPNTSVLQGRRVNDTSEIQPWISQLGL